MKNHFKPIVNRHIHLDYHTSGLIQQVAEDFDADTFIRTLKDAHVGGICLFARCHHGYCYYPTRVGTPHPHLKERDLLGKQLAAVRAAGMQPGLYTTICWDELSAAQHPEWVCHTTDNKIMKMDPLTGQEMGVWDPGWTFLCWNSPYREYFKNHIKELLAGYSADFIFLDILFNRTPCVCPHCIGRMQQCGLNAESRHDREKNSIDSAREFMAEISELIGTLNPAISPFYNSRLRVTGQVDQGSMPELEYQGMIAIESLPSGPWGYDHFPIFARYFQHINHPLMGHTGKFQKMWGDFGGLKNQAALDYEVMRMMAHGVAACVGDQLHPRGVLDQATYKLIGNTFKKIRPFEHYLLPSCPIDEIGILLTNKPRIAKNIGSELDAETGAMKMLTQLQYQYSFIDATSDFSGYKLLILPDAVWVDEALSQKLNNYVAKGGKILASYEGGMDAEGRLALDAMPLAIAEDLTYEPHYFYPTEELIQSDVIADTDHVMYLAGKTVRDAALDYRVLCRITEPYFNRTWEHFCSHLQTPPARRTEMPAMLYNGSNSVYFAGEIFSCYQNYSPKVLKQLVDYGIRLLLSEKLVESNLPSTAEVLLRRNSAGQTVLTILHYVHQRRCKEIDIVEDVLPLHNISLSIYCDKKPKMILETVTGNKLEFNYALNRVQITIPVLNGCAVVVY